MPTSQRTNTAVRCRCVLFRFRHAGLFTCSLAFFTNARHAPDIFRRHFQLFVRPSGALFSAPSHATVVITTLTRSDNIDAMLMMNYSPRPAHQQQPAKPISPVISGRRRMVSTCHARSSPLSTAEPVCSRYYVQVFTPNIHTSANNATATELSARSRDRISMRAARQELYRGEPFAAVDNRQPTEPFRPLSSSRHIHQHTPTAVRVDMVVVQLREKGRQTA